MKMANERSFAPGAKSGGQLIGSSGTRPVQLEAVSSIHGARLVIRRYGTPAGGKLGH